MKRRISRDEAMLCEQLGHQVLYYVEVSNTSKKFNGAQVRPRVHATVPRDAEISLTAKKLHCQSGCNTDRGYHVVRQALEDDLANAVTRDYLITKISQVVGIKDKAANAILSDLIHRKRVLRVAS